MPILIVVIDNASIFKSGNVTSDETSPTEFSLWIGGQEVTKLDTLFINTVHNTLYNESSGESDVCRDDSRRW